MVFTGDTSQIDAPYLGESNNALAVLTNALFKAESAVHSGDGGQQRVGLPGGLPQLGGDPLHKSKRVFQESGIGIGAGNEHQSPGVAQIEISLDPIGGKHLGRQVPSGELLGDMLGQPGVILGDENYFIRAGSSVPGRP